MFHAVRWAFRNNVLLVLLLFGTTFLGGVGQTAAQEPAEAVATLTGTAYRLVDQTIVDGVVMDQTELPINDGRLAIPELGIDMPLASDGSFELTNLPVDAASQESTEVTVIFTAPGLGSFTFLHLRIGQGYRPILTPQLIEAPRVSDVVYHNPHSGTHQDAADDMGDGTGVGSLASAAICAASREPLVLPPTIRVLRTDLATPVVESVDFKFYVKHVLPREWKAPWDDESLLAGAIAVKSYGWRHATHAHHKNTGAGCFDVDAGIDHQVYNPNLADERTNDAVDLTWDFYMIEGTGLDSDVVEAFHKAGSKYFNDPPPAEPVDWDACGEWWGPGAPGNDMSQWGSHSCAAASMLWPQILATYYFPPPVSWILLRASDDTDGDGCPNGAEVGTDEAAGGRRNLQNPWDYFDPTHDGLNRIPDVLMVIQQYFKDEGVPGYNPDTDRTWLGPNLWNLGPPDGRQRVPDILAEVYQYFHDCG